MNKLVPMLLAVLLTGCVPEISGNLLTLAEEFCGPNRGIGHIDIRSGMNNAFRVYCGNGVTAWITPTGVSK